MVMSMVIDNFKNKEQMEDIKKKLEGCREKVDSDKEREKIGEVPTSTTTSIFKQQRGSKDT